MNTTNAFPEDSGWSAIDAILYRNKRLATINCSLIQMYHPARFVATMRGETIIPEVHGPLLLRPMHFLIRMLVAPSGQRFRQEPPETDLGRYRMKFEFPFLSLNYRGSTTKAIKTWDVTDRRHWSLSGDELVAKLATSFIYPEWIATNWKLMDHPSQWERNGNGFLDVRLICTVDGGQPIPGGVNRATSLSVRFDLQSGIMVRRVAMLYDVVVEQSRLVAASSVSWNRG